MIKLILRIILPVLVLAGAGYATVTIIRNRPAPETREAEIPLPLVETMETGYSNVTLSVFAEGTVAPRTVSELTPEVSGRVIDVAESLVVGGVLRERGPAAPARFP